MNASKTAVAAALQAVLDLHNGGSLVIYDGTKPAAAYDAIGAAAALVSPAYAATAFGAQSFASEAQQADASFTAASYDPAATGAATWARAYQSDGTTAIADYTVGSAWRASNVAAVGQFCTNGGNTYQVISVTGDAKTAASGGPTGTAGSITDGNVTWQYIGAGQLFDVLLGNCNVQVGTQVSVTQTISMPLGA